MRLQLTRRADYAVRAMLALSRDPSEIQSGGRIAAAMDIPPRFVAQVMGDLVDARLVDGFTGRRGGYRLARPASEISILQVVEAVEGDLRRARTCVLRGGPCTFDGRCDVHETFAGAQDALLHKLAVASLASIVEGSQAELAREGRSAPGDGPDGHGARAPGEGRWLQNT